MHEHTVEIAPVLINSGNGGGLTCLTGVKATAGSYMNTTCNCGTATTKAMMSIAIKP